MMICLLFTFAPRALQGDLGRDPLSLPALEPPPAPGQGAPLPGQQPRGRPLGRKGLRRPRRGELGGGRGSGLFSFLHLALRWRFCGVKKKNIRAP